MIRTILPIAVQQLSLLKQGISTCRGVGACGTGAERKILQRNFVITEKLFLWLEYEIARLRGKWLLPSKSKILYGFPIGAWTIPGLERTAYERLFIDGDIHFSAEGNKLMFRELAKHLL